MLPRRLDGNKQQMAVDSGCGVGHQVFVTGRILILLPGERSNRDRGCQVLWCIGVGA